MTRAVKAKSLAVQYADTLGGLRNERVELKERLRKLDLRSLPSDAVAANVAELLARNEAAARTWLSFGSLSMASQGSLTINVAAAFKHEPLGTLAILGDRSALFERFVAEAEAARSGEAMTDEAYNAARSGLSSSLGDIERREESLIREAERNGLTFARRPDADPALFLAPDEDFE